MCYKLSKEDYQQLTFKKLKDDLLKMLPNLMVQDNDVSIVECEDKTKYGAFDLIGRVVPQCLQYDFVLLLNDMNGGSLGGTDFELVFYDYWGGKVCIKANPWDLIPIEDELNAEEDKEEPEEECDDEDYDEYKYEEDFSYDDFVATNPGIKEIEKMLEISFYDLLSTAYALYYKN